jgi:Serine/threonine protein kinase
MSQFNSPADKLEGVTLSSGWKVLARIVKSPGASGGNFGICYHAEKDGRPGFVKALDFRRAFHEKDFILALNQLTSHVLWEKELLEFCNKASMSRVVRLLDYEDLILDEDQGDQTKKVCCLIFEVGAGDLRTRFDIARNPSHSWRLRVLRDVGLALDQLHRKGVAHLDVKPSNVIALAESQFEVMKLGDLGRAVRKGMPGPFDAMAWPGDVGYMPPEKWYGHNSQQWNDEREAADAYLFGSLFAFLFTGVPMNNLLHNEIPDAFKPQQYRGVFDRQLIDVLRQAQAKVIAIYLRPALPACIAQEIESMFLELTDPDPTTRGDRKARARGIVGIDRYHQKLLKLAERMSLHERGILA